MARAFLMLFLLAGCANTPAGTSNSVYNTIAIGPNEEINVRGYNRKEMSKYRCIKGVMVWDQVGAIMSGQCYGQTF